MRERPSGAFFAMKVELSPDSHEVTLKDLELFFPSYSYLHEFILSINQKEALEEGIFTDLSVPLMVVTASPLFRRYLIGFLGSWGYGARGLGWSLNFWTSLVGRIFSNKENPKMSASKVRT